MLPRGPVVRPRGQPLDCDIPFGRIFRISPQKEWDLVVQYDGWPNGLKFHKDGRAFIADYKKGLLVLDPQTARLEPILETAYSEGFKGLNDLHFAANGDLYFTDQGQTGIADPTGRVYRLCSNGALDRLCANVPSPNGITLSTTEQHCYVAVTRSQQIWRLPLMADGSVSKTGVAIQLSGGAAGRTASKWTRKTAWSSAISASACGASTPTCCRPISCTPTVPTIITWTTVLSAARPPDSLHHRSAVRRYSDGPYASRGKLMYGLQ
jgi:hypothetical protein